MLAFSYLLSPTVKLEIEKIERTRRDILLELISPRIERRIRFEIQVKVIAACLFISGKSASSREIVNILKGIRTESSITQDVISVRNAFDYIRENWLLEQQPITESGFNKLIKILSGKEKINVDRINQILAFINTGNEHPIVQSALCFVLLLGEIKEEKNSIKLASIVSILFAYDHGYDFRGLLNLQEYFISDLTNLVEKAQSALKRNNLSDFIEYYVQVFSVECENAYKRASSAKQNPNHTLNLTQREQKILALFEIPDVKITNRDIQKEYKVSQITASRDLASLATLGLILRRGKGRSIYYVKS